MSFASFPLGPAATRSTPPTMIPQRIPRQATLGCMPTPHIRRQDTRREPRTLANLGLPREPFLTPDTAEPIFPARGPSVQAGPRGIPHPCRIPGDEMEPHPGSRNAGGQHTLMDGGVSAAEASRSRFSRLTERFLGRRRNYVVDPSYQVRSAIIAVLGMGFLLVFAGALFHLLSVENARLVARRAPNLTGAAGSGELRSVLYLVAD